MTWIMDYAYFTTNSNWGIENNVERSRKRKGPSGGGYYLSLGERQELEPVETQKEDGLILLIICRQTPGLTAL